jgi:replication initiation protein RepC
MEYTPKSFFGRPVSAALREDVRVASRCTQVDKWQVLDALSTARETFGLRHSDLAVLGALLSFHPQREIDLTRMAPVVFASNRVLCERLNGMPDSTMRRHLARLLDAGIVSRQDSPNGKRYVRRARDGSVLRAFGFDLTPLVARAPEIEAAAQEARDMAEQLARLRETVSLMRRDLDVLLAQDLELPERLAHQTAELVAHCRKVLRRKPKLEELRALRRLLEAGLEACTPVEAAPIETEEMSTKPVEDEQHYQRTNKDLSDSVLAVAPDQKPKTATQDQRQAENTEPQLSDVLRSCPTISEYYPGDLRHWRDVEERSYLIAPMLGIGADVIATLREAAGRVAASVAILCVLERAEQIKNPAGYLRRLAQNAQSGKFDVRNLLRTAEKAHSRAIVS